MNLWNKKKSHKEGNCKTLTLERGRPSHTVKIIRAESPFSGKTGRFCNYLKVFLCLFVSLTTLGAAIFSLTGCGKESDSSSASSEQLVFNAGKQINLEGIINVRDLGGYQTKDEKTIKPHKLIRGAELSSLTENDIKILTKEYDVRKIVDFRTDSEMRAKPDPEIDGVENFKNPIMRDIGNSASQEDFMKNLMTAGNPEEYLKSINKNFITDEFSKKAYKRFFDILLENENGAVLWHCTAGKDRAGFGAVLILSALGVDRDTIMKDYLLTNRYREEENRKQVERIAKATNNNEKAIASMRAMMDVRESYLESAYGQIEKDYGDMNTFLTKGLGLSSADLNKLQMMYLQ